jgi:DNA-binding protein H-NS
MPKNEFVPVDRPVEEIQAQIAQLDAEKAALQAALRERHAAEFAKFVNEFREQIFARGYRVDDVLARLGKGDRQRSAKTRSVRITRYIDPEVPERSYARGPLPAWLREKMQAAGYDPADKAQRDAFKATHLQQAA